MTTYLLIAFWIFLLGMAWYPCCGGGACTHCSTTTPATIACVFTASVATCGACFDSGETYVLAWSAGCIWGGSGTMTCTGPDDLDISITASIVSLPLGNCRWEVEMFLVYPLSPVDTQFFTYYGSSVSSPMDCTAQVVLTDVSADITPNFCLHDGDCKLN